MIDAKYTKGLGWKDNKDSGGQTPAELVPLSDHCEYKYVSLFEKVSWVARPA